MTSILSKQNETSFQKVSNFYARRIRRIFPSYFILLSVTLALGHLILIDFDFTFLSNETLWAAVFGTNLRSLFEKESFSYFRMQSEYRFLLHTWSLGVEIQFYFFAPFLITFISKHPFPRVSVLMGMSLALQLYFHNSSFSFDFFLCRFWQFLAGTLSYYIAASSTSYVLLSSNETHIPSIYHSFSYFLTSLALITLCFAPKIPVFPEFITFTLRLLSTSLAALLIFLASSFQPRIPEFWDKGLNYLGDISYSIYLFHWPILLFSKYTAVFYKHEGKIFLKYFRATLHPAF